MTLTKTFGLMTAAVLCAAGAANAAIFNYETSLSGPAESPPNASPGTGFATLVIDTTLNTMTIDVSFSGLTGNTTAAHIHAATAAAGVGTAGVATQTPTFSGFPLGVTAGTYNRLFDMTLTSSFNAAYITANGGTPASAFAALKAAIDAGKAYLNIHSSTFGGGEIRGFWAPVPTPGAASLLGVAGLAGLRRRR